MNQNSVDGATVSLKIVVNSGLKIASICVLLSMDEIRHVCKSLIEMVVSTKAPANLYR